MWRLMTLGLFFTIPLFSQAETYLLSQEQVQKMNCSSLGLTRISLDEGEIVNVISLEGELDYFLVNQGAQLVINSLNKQTPLVFLTSKGKAGSVILTPTNTLLENHLVGFLEKRNPEIIMRRILNGEMPKNFHVQQLRNYHEKNAIGIENSQLLTNDEYTFIKFKIYNLSDNPVSTKKLIFPRSEKIIYEKDIINPKDYSHACAIIKIY